MLMVLAVVAWSSRDCIYWCRWLTKKESQGDYDEGAVMWKSTGVSKPEADAPAAAARAPLGGIVEEAGSAFVKCRGWSGLVVR